MNSFFRVKIVYLLLSLISLPSFSAIFFVNASSNCTTCDGGSWSTPYKDLQLALAAAAPGDQIWVAKGTYKPSVSNIDASFVLKNDVSIYGGFAGTETAPSQRNKKLNVSILSGDLLGNDDTTNINIANTTRFDNSINVVKCTTALVNTTILDGFTIMAGNADKQTTTGLTGGGLLLGANGCNPNIRNCVFKHNTSNFGGGAVEAGYDTKAQFDSCTFMKNVTNASSNGGGAIKCSSSAKPIFRACQFLNNTATPTGTGTSGSGGAIQVQNTSSPDFYACLFKNNACTGTNQQGGAVYVVSSANQASARFDNCVFSGNIANQGSVANLWQSVANFYNCVFYNHASSLIYVSGTNTVRPLVYNSIFYNNTGTENINAALAPAYYNTILQSTACPPGATCNCGVLYATDPLFVDAVNGNFRLSAGSLGINTGDKTVVTETKDIYGNTRIQNTFVDMGVAENASTALATVNVANGATVLSNGAASPLDFGTTSLGKSISKTITITNKGTGTLILCNPSLTSNFSITGTYANSLAPNASTDLTMIMDGQTAGAVTGKLTFTNNDPANSTYVINLAANVLQAMPQGNRGMYFDGVDDIIETTNLNLLPVTYEAWIKASRIKGANIVSMLGAGGGSDGFDIQVNPGDGQIVVSMGKDGSRNWIFSGTNNTIKVNQWTHVAGTYDGTTINVYINGILCGSASGTKTPTGTAKLTIGGGIMGRFHGQIDEVRVFNKVRTQSEIQSDMSSTTVNGAVGYWDFEDDASTGVQTTAANLGTLGSTAAGVLAASPASPLWALRVTKNTDIATDQGSLRWAVTETNTDTDTDYIDFSIQQTDATVAGGTSTITQTSLFPDISQPVILDGYSAYGSSRNTNAFAAGSNAQVRILLEGFGTAATNHTLSLTGNNSIIKGLSITKGYDAINITGNNNQIAGNFIGLKTDGNTSAGSLYAGLIVAGTSNTVGTLVAPSNMADLNVIAGSSRAISLTATGAVVRYNYINTNNSGVVLSSGSDGIALENTNTGVSIENNVIAANGTSSAVRITGTAVSSNTTIKNNYMGVGANGSALFTIGNGINVANASTKTRIVNNTIANGLLGIVIGNGYYGTIFSQNKIYCNKQSAINLNTSGNNSKAVPVITTASTTTIAGTCTAGDTIEIFSDTTCGAANQGKYYVGRVVTPTTNWSYTGAFVNGQKITATASDGNNGTSAFATASVVGAAAISQPNSNQGLYFDGVDDQVVFNPGFKFAGNSIYTLEAWVKVPDNGRPKNIFFQPSDITVTGSHAIAVFVESDGRISFANDKFSNGGWTVHSTVAKIPYKTWTHIAVASNGTGVKSIYINGVNQDNLVVTGSSGTGNAYLTATAPNTDWFIGKVGYYNNSAFEGEMDEVKIFNVFHKDVDVLKDMASTTTDGAVAYWKLDESLGQAALDVTGTHNGKLGTDGSMEAIDPLWAYQVTNTSDVATTVGSLRWALTEAEKDTDTDYIDFSIQQDGTVSVIKPATELIITKPVILDGYSAFGSSVNTNSLDKGLNAKLKLGLDLSSFSSFTTDITPIQFINVDNSIVRGLSFFGLPYNGKGHQCMNFNNGKNNRVSGCWFGVRADGTAGTNMNGVYFIGGDGNILGYSGNKPDVSAANIIANCQYQGVNNSGSTNFVAQGNYFGLGTDGKSGASIGQWGILTSGNGSVIRNNVIGKCGDKAIGILASNVTVQGNLLGVGADTTTAVGNSVGVYVESGNNNKIGGTGAGETNYIANNGIGVQVDGATTIKNRITGNNIYANTTSGISLTNGGNNLKAVPLITSITASSVSGTCAAGDTVDVYNDKPQSGTTNQGRKYLGRASTTGTSWVYKGTFQIGDRLTATATDAANGTSAFSAANTLSITPPYPIVGSQEVKLAWQPITGATSYTISFGTDSNNVSTRVVHKDSLSTTIASLTNDVVYYFAIEATGGTRSKFIPAVPVIQSGKALNFNASQYVDLTPNVSKLSGWNAGTISGWFKSDRVGQGDASIIYSAWAGSNNWLQVGLGGIGSWAPNHSFYFLLARGSTGANVLGMFVVKGYEYYNDGQWHHFAVVTGDGNNRILIDGEEQLISYTVGSKTTNEFSNMGPLSASANARIGNRNYDNTNLLYFYGQLDEIGLWNVPLTNAQIHAIRDKNIRGNEAGIPTPQLLYHFDEPSGTKVYDASPNALNAIKVNAPAVLASRAMFPYKATIAKVNRKANSTQVYVKTNKALDVASHTLLRYNKGTAKWDSVATQQYVSKSDTVISYESPSACDSFLVKVYSIDSAGQKGFVSDSMWVLPAISSIDSALVAYYSFDGNATDQISGIKGVVSGGVSTTTDRFGKAGQAYQFDGVNGYINTNQNLSWTYDKSFTMSLWVQQSVKTKYKKNQVLLGKTYATNGYEYFLGIDSTGTQFANWFTGGTGNVFNSKYNNAFVPNWRHLVVSYDASQHVLRQYENGILKITSNPMQASPNNILNGGPLLIGNGSPGAGIFGTLQMFKGKLDDIRIYNRALTAEDIVLLHDYQVDTLCKNSVFALSPYPVAGYTSYWMDKTHTKLTATSIAGPQVAGTQYLQVVKNINRPCDSTIIVHEIAVGNSCTPKQVYATTGNKQVEVHWKPMNGVAEYTMYYGKDSTGVLQTLKATDTVAVITGLQNDSLYFFAVSAGGDTSRFDAAVPVVESGSARVFTTNTQVQVKPLVQNKTTYTITAWVKRKTSGTIYSEGNPALLFHFAVTADGKLMLNPNNGLGWDPRITNTTIPLNEWTFVAASFNNGLVNLIINDKVETFSNVKVSYSTLYAAIGMTRESNYPLDGEIDEVSFWNKALSVDQLQKIKDKNIRGDESGVIGLYHFDESKGNKVYDASPYGNDGILVNASSSVVSKAMMPYQPTNFVASSVDEGIDLTWSKNIALDVKHIKIYRSKTSTTDTTGLLLKTIPYSITDTTFRDTSVLSCNTYYYKIVGVDSSGQVGVLSLDSSAKYCIEPPIALAATHVSNSGFIAHWQKVSGAKSYYVELAKDTSFVPLVKQLSVTDTLVAINGLNTNTVYFYRVSAVRGDTSEPSNQKMTSTILPPGSGMGLFMKDTGYVQLLEPLGGYNDTSYTYEAWFKTPLTHGTEKILLGGYDLAIGAVGDTITMFEYGDGFTFKSSFGYRTDSLTAGWHHLAVVASQDAGTSKLYVDGINRGSVSRFRNNQLQSLGGDGYSYSFGTVDELRVWNTTRSQEQIQALMCQKLHGDESGLVGYFQLDEGLGTVVENKASLSSIDGLLVNGPIWSTSGAALGDTSVNTYSGNSLVFKDLSNTQKDQAALVLKSGSSKGLHIYKVRTAPNNVAKPATDIDSLDTSRYFGSFVVDGKNTRLDFTYHYSNNTKVGKKDTLLNLLERVDNASGAFKVADSTTVDLSKKTITAVNDVQRKEYILGFNVLPKIVFTTPTTLTYGEDPLKLKADTNVTSVVTYTVSDTTIAKIVDGNKVIPLKDGTVTITASINNGKVKSTQTIKVSVPPFAILGKKFVTELTNETYELSPIVSGLSYSWTYSGVDVLLDTGSLSNSLNVLFKKTATDGNLICTITNPLYKSAPIIVTKEIVVYHPGDVITKVNCDTVISNTKACSGNYLNGVQLLTIQNLNSGCSDGGYEDYTKSILVASLYLGNPINASLHIGNNGVSQNQKNYVGIWLDYNNNGSFDDAGEFLLSDFSEDSVINLKNMVISTNVEYAGERRMRIRVRSTELVKNESCVSYNESGETEDYKVILMIPDHLEAPVLLTPNDDGKNDFFVIKGINASGGVNKLTILDRLGTVLYTQDGYDNTWRGIDNNGKLLPQDTYYYHYVNGQNIIKGFFEIRY